MTTSNDIYPFARRGSPIAQMPPADPYSPKTASYRLASTLPPYPDFTMRKTATKTSIETVNDDDDDRRRLPDLPLLCSDTVYGHRRSYNTDDSGGSDDGGLDSPSDSKTSKHNAGFRPTTSRRLYSGRDRKTGCGGAGTYRGGKAPIWTFASSAVWTSAPSPIWHPPPIAAVAQSPVMVGLPLTFSAAAADAADDADDSSIISFDPPAADFVIASAAPPLTIDSSEPPFFNAGILDSRPFPVGGFCVRSKRRRSSSVDAVQTAVSAETTVVAEPVIIEPAAVEPVIIEPVAIKPVTIEPVTIEPVTAAAASAVQTDIKTNCIPKSSSDCLPAPLWTVGTDAATESNRPRKRRRRLADKWPPFIVCERVGCSFMAATTTELSAHERLVHPTTAVDPELKNDRKTARKPGFILVPIPTTSIKLSKRSVLSAS